MPGSRCRGKPNITHVAHALTFKVEREMAWLCATNYFNGTEQWGRVCAIMKSTVLVRTGPVEVEAR